MGEKKDAVSGSQSDHGRHNMFGIGSSLPAELLWEFTWCSYTVAKLGFLQMIVPLLQQTRLLQ